MECNRCHACGRNLGMDEFVKEVHNGETLLFCGGCLKLRARIDELGGTAEVANSAEQQVADAYSLLRERGYNAQGRSLRSVLDGILTARDNYSNELAKAEAQRIDEHLARYLAASRAFLDSLKELRRLHGEVPEEFRDSVKSPEALARGMLDVPPEAYADEPFRYKGYGARVEFDKEIDLFCGEVTGMKDVVTFQGRSLEQAQQEFRNSVDDYLEFVATGVKPWRTTMEVGK